MDSIERLILHPFETSDAEGAFRWFGDSIVMRFTPGGPDSSIEQTQERIAKYKGHQIAHGFSKWIVLDRATGTPMGDSGLLDTQFFHAIDDGWIDLGFRFAQAYWGKGLATEVASAWVDAAFNRLHFDRLTAIVHPANGASLRVLAKLNFRENRRDTILGMESIILTRDRESKPKRGLT
jgi:[ribosomal protein S5]-alanine N-acetyltransferase